jgi:hypothetical protein
MVNRNQGYYSVDLDFKNFQEQLLLTKQNLELQVKQATGLLNAETKAKQKAEMEIKQLRDRLQHSGGLPLPYDEPKLLLGKSDADPVDRLALTGLTLEEKQWLCTLSVDDKKQV